MCNRLRIGRVVVFSSPMNDADEKQRAYYEETARRYDDDHGAGEHPEHERALEHLCAYIEREGAASVLDVGAGTGRAMLRLRERFPDLRTAGVEPVEALREAAYQKGVPRDALLEGDGRSLPFEAAEFDVVCAFGVLHHVRRPNAVVAEMSRVAGRAVGISDSNFLGQGAPWVRLLKDAIFRAGLWPIADRIKTRGRGYRISEGDGVSYSYSVYQSRSELLRSWERLEWYPTSGDLDPSAPPRRRAGHIFVLASGKTCGI